MKKRIASFNQFNKLNEAGWDSIIDNFGEIVVNGVVLKTTAACVYDTPYDISYEVWVMPTEQDLIKMGVWSNGYLEEDELYRRMYIYEKSKEFTSGEMESMGFSNVRDMEDSDIVDYFSDDYYEKVPNEEMTSEKFIELIQSVPFNTEQYGLEDIHLINSEAEPGYKLLGRLGAFKNK
jgi:hypothetical protein